MKRFLAAMVVVGALSATTPASADELWMYGAVVCQGDRAMVRFAAAYNETAPVFSAPPAAVDRGLSRIAIRDPSTCTFDDGRVVHLAHTMLADATPYGMAGGISSNVFTLSIGDRVLYRRDAIWRTREPFQTLATVIIEPERVLECRYTEGSLEPEQPGRPQTCTNASQRLAGLEPDRSRGAPGTLHLERSAPGEEGFCRALVVPAARLFSSPLDAWPAFVSSLPAEMIVDREDARYRLRDKLLADGFDLDNDGVHDRPVLIESEGNYIDAAYWALPPRPVRERRIMRADAHDFTDNVDTLRAEGWRVFAGDQTTYGEIRYVTLTPIFRFGDTYFHARWAVPNQPLSDLVMRPGPDGGMDEVCVFTVVPAL
ncbi:hypothetical protein [Terricaulis silvestris]|uniref:YARHG domain-containing protein n=1 Tax=Terricaulis silvestris TaxID=2686094 RepID=A0A6I6MQZ6_9CAUL|nr:hypothetical protein [Terricaulis silvestris]QGZ97049.1 hypothetical protein DSM104635_03914 [Terricaulis silvestris]